MIKKNNHVKHSSFYTSIYANRYNLEDFDLAECNENGMPAKLAKQLIQDELTIQSMPIANLASFVTTWMEPEAEELIKYCINKNFVNYEEYPQIQKVHGRCIHILAKLLNIPKDCNYSGTSTVGSSEAILLAGLAYKFLWRNKRKGANLDCSKPNIIMGADVHTCWEKFARYFDVEPRIIPMEKNKYIITAADVEPLIDENTICVAAVMGTTFTGEYDDIEGINKLLLKIKKTKKLDIPLHIDAASGGFIAMFYNEKKIKWDFALEQVKSINLSGHKYGLVYPSVGWLIFRDADLISQDLIFDLNYLGGHMPTYTLNFSRDSSMVIAQYYNFLRLGKKGYKKIIKNMMCISDIISKAFLDTGKFIVLGERRMEPVITVALKNKSKYSVFDISRELHSHGWFVPAYTMPHNAEQVEVLRVVVKENMSYMLAQNFICSLNEVLNEFAGKPSRVSKKKAGKKMAIH